MLGPDFLRFSNQNLRRCSCNTKSCWEAGYFPSHHALEIPQSFRQTILSGQGRLFSGETVQAYIDDPRKRMYLYPWHFFRDHLIFENNTWKFDYNAKAENPKKYYDMERKQHIFPPPINNVDRFIEEELFCYVRPQDRWATDNGESKMPTWMLNMLEIDEELSIAKEPSPRKVKKEKESSCVRSLQIKLEMYRARVDCLRNRMMALQLSADAKRSAAKEMYEKAMKETKEIHDKAMEETKESHKKAVTRLKQNYEDRLREKDTELGMAKATISVQEQTIARLEEMIKELEEENRHKSELLKQQWQTTARPFTYEDLCDGGVLGKNVKDFTFFDTKEQNDLFLEVINFADGTEGSFPEGDGLCENLRPYNKIKDGNGGRASDVMMTDHTGILRLIPFGHTGKMDKGFPVDNIAAREGVIIDRPQKRRQNQKQQSAIDTAQTQKIGNTRIIIENVNGGVKMDVRYLNALIPCTQFGIISKVVRIGFLLQNFKKPFIQNRNPDGASDTQEGRPCRAEIRWYGATDAGLSDVRGSINLWGYKCEKERYAQLRSMEEHKDKSEVEIGEMALNERWDLKLREELYQMHNRVYDGEKFNQELYESHGVN